MVKHGLNLVYDLCRFLRLHRQVLNRMRQFVVDALHFVSSLCHEQEIAALYAFRGDPSRRFWWAKHGDKVIEFLGYQLGFKSPDRVFRDAGKDALKDLKIRKQFRKAVKNRLEEEDNEPLEATYWARGSIFVRH